LAKIGSSTHAAQGQPISIPRTLKVILAIAKRRAPAPGEQLPISRWQRDLTDSNGAAQLGVASRIAVIAYESL